MPFLIALAGIAIAAFVWAQRARTARDTAIDLADMANDVRLAARRFGFRRQTNIHPVESIEDPRLTIAAIATAFIELDTLPTAEMRAQLMLQLRSKLQTNADEAEEMEVLGRWLMTECGGAEPAIARLSRKLYKLGGAEQLDPLVSILKATVKAPLTPPQRDALADITRALRAR